MPIENASEIKERDSELENSVGLIFVSEHHRNRAEKSVARKFSPHVPPAYHRKKRNSVHTFKHNGKCYRIFLEVEDLGSFNMTDGAKVQGIQPIFGKYLYLPFPHPSMNLFFRRFL
jgi:hypothetical protein